MGGEGESAGNDGAREKKTNAGKGNGILKGISGRLETPSAFSYWDVVCGALPAGTWIQGMAVSCLRAGFGMQP